MSLPISSHDSSARGDLLLRNAVAAYCALIRPGRKEADQLQDLALPLLDTATESTLRYAAATLSRCEMEPRRLIQRLAEMPIEIAAPVLQRAKSLDDLDLLNIIRKRGLTHARAIGSRDGLNPSIFKLVELVENRSWRPVQEDIAAEAARAAKAPSPAARPVATPPVGGPMPMAAAAPSPAPIAAVTRLETAPSTPSVPKPVPAPLTLEETRQRLRTIMRATATETTADVDIDDIYEDMREAALSGSAEQFSAALANALGVLLPLARTIVRDDSLSMLTPALRSLNFTEEEAFLLISALHPGNFTSAEAIRSYLRSYRLMSFDDIEVHLNRWQETGAAVTARALRSA